MEFSKHSANISDEFQFKYIPKVELEKVIKKVKMEVRSLHEDKSGMWNNFCTVSSELNAVCNKKRSEMNNVRVMTNDEVNLVLKGNENKFIAPLFGPPRRFYASSSDKKESEKSTTKSQAQSSKNDEMKMWQNAQISSTPVVEEINVADIQQLKQSPRCDVQVKQNKITAATACSLDDSSCSSDDDDTLTLDGEQFLKELEELKRQEEEEEEKLKNKKKEHLNETEKKLICDTSDKKFDFRNDDCSEKSLKSLPQPTVRTEKNIRSAPKIEKNQLSNNRRQHRVEKSNVKVSKEAVRAQNLVKVSSNANEKSLVPSSSPTIASAHFYLLISKVGGYQEKTCHYLDCLGEIICNPPQMIDVNDLSRRKQRSTEFANRFSRNHLYQIERTTEELRIMSDNPVDIAAKVETLFLYIMQAIQSYLKCVEMFIYNSCPDKLSALIESIVHACKICFERNAFSNKDAIFVEILRKCDEMRSFLVMNKKSQPTFMTFTTDFHAKVLPKNSKMYVSPYFNPYALRKVKSPYAPPKNPHPIPKMKSRAKSIESKSARQSDQVRKNSTQSNKNKQQPKIKRSNSEISTIIGRENLASQKKQIKNLVDMVHTVTQEKISVIVDSLFKQITPEQVTKEVKKPKTQEISSDEKSEAKNEIKSPKDVSKSDDGESEQPSSMSNASISDTLKKNVRVVTYKEKPQNNDEHEKEKLRKLREQALAERLKIIESQSNNPLYNNSSFNEPWKMVAEVSDKLLEEMLENLIKDFDFGEKSFVESFLKHELTC
ncbi:hypothetical protein PVAND_006020 [Polypedilum vanderplanki]|uniref:Uncharacterized protein n=1 Tax=Polypedilum vanderplanki TaxID=319348 RepID=A0A9J6C2Y0_POLVA|nr:hypothetical protein PVAND_006020 [Polypedilum vanderplanki]